VAAQVFIRGANYIASDWLLRWSAQRYRAEVRLHAEVALLLLATKPPFQTSCLFLSHSHASLLQQHNSSCTACMPALTEHVVCADGPQHGQAVGRRGLRAATLLRRLR
jgi:hypothetical protein